ncbi:MAG TPA: zinc-binding dehydrogenase [Gaiellaceae bacterium]|nr:zinc-binding dehydrogenase [Gaiellaceae bacterium]
MKAVYYEGGGRFALREAEPRAPERGEVRLDVAYCGICGTDLHIAHGAMDHRVQVPQVIGHEMSGRVAELGPGVEGFEIGEPVVVRPLDTRDETPADKGYAHVGRNLRFLGIDAPGAFQGSWTVPAFTLHRLPRDVDLKVAALTEPLAVACHDVRRGELRRGETAVVLGGGPIGLLVALVAREAGARVVVGEIHPGRRVLASGLGLEVVDPRAVDVAEHVASLTAGAGADVVFEVSGSAAAVLDMTRIASVRGRIVLVAIFPEPKPVRLFDFFWKELELRGARVYEPEDYEHAIELVTTGRLPLDRLITTVEPLERLPAVFEEHAEGSTAMKILVDCTE